MPSKPTTNELSSQHTDTNLEQDSEPTPLPPGTPTQNETVNLLGKKIWVWQYFKKNTIGRALFNVCQV
jgi:hypothetical protein